jgi:hypothetical protein
MLYIYTQLDSLLTKRILRNFKNKGAGTRG